MAKGKYISVGQIPKLQTLWSQWSAVSFDYSTRAIVLPATERARRLEWASEQLGRQVESFKDLTRSEASQLIDVLLRSTGQEVIAPDRSKKRKSREDAHAAGTAGRRGGQSKEIRLASADDLAAIDELLSELAWDRARLDAWLKSPSSPLGRRSNPEIRTLADANKVRWALKRMRDREQKKVSA
jgi:hypothetical protein